MRRNCVSGLEARGGGGDVHRDLLREAFLSFEASARVVRQLWY